jgi:hypothetical protein
VKLKLVEFLYFYLLPETPTLPSARGGDVLQRSPSKLGAAFYDKGHRRAKSEAAVQAVKRLDPEGGTTRTTGEKQALLGKYLGNVDDLVGDLRESGPFGGVFC